LRGAYVSDMTAVAERLLLPEAPGRRVTVTPWLVIAGLASLGAGAIHFAAAGVHGDHLQTVYVFTALAVAQVGWGGAALARRDRLMAQAGVLLGLVGVVGWALAKGVGLPFIDGLQTPEPVQLADVSAAVLAAVATLLAAAAVSRGGAAGLRLPMWVFAAAMTAVTVIGTVATSGHHHQGVGALPHVHGGTLTSSVTHVHAVPYDPSLPIDLSGTPGVTPQQQAAAENLVAITLARLPQWADAKVAERAGFHTIGDGFTGTEHLINQAFLKDKHTLDPDHPESLVYDTTGGGRRLVAAMFMLAPGTPLSAVPDIGGALVQWHIHDNLCFSPSGYVQGITNAAGQCPTGQVKPTPAPMVHVWITKNACGPFAALEGIGGGTIAAGQTRLCDHLHGSTS
jgi:hypothetical protein